MEIVMLEDGQPVSNERARRFPQLQLLNTGVIELDRLKAAG